MDIPPSSAASPPESPSPPQSPSPRQDDTGVSRRPKLTYLDGLALVAGLQIGAGIFSTPAVVAEDVQSTRAAVLVWFAAGLLVWTGAASFIELGTRIPTNGGMQQYLRLCLGDTYGFLFAWTWILVVKPTSTAMISTIFAEYFCGVIVPRSDGEEGSTVVIKAVALAALATMTGLNCAGAKIGTRSARAFLGLKVLGLMSIGFAGLVYAFSPSQGPSNVVVRAAPSSQRLLPVSNDRHGLWDVIGGVADGMFAALFAYGGWDCIGYVVGEIQNPADTLPRILHHSMAIVLALFLVANITMYAVVPLDAMHSDAIAVRFGRLVFGEAGAIMYSTIVCISCLGSLNATIIAVGRLTEAASQQQYIPWFIGMPSAPQGYHPVPLELSEHSLPQQETVSQPDSSTAVQAVPVRAMLANGILGAIYLATGSFRGLLTFKGIIEYFGYLCTLIGLIKIQNGRHLDPAVTSSEYYHTWRGLPYIFSIASSMLVLRGGVQHPFQVASIVGFWTAALLVRSSKWWKEKVAAPDAIRVQGVS